MWSIALVCPEEESDTHEEKYPPPREPSRLESILRFHDLSRECEKEEESHNSENEYRIVSEILPRMDRSRIESDDEKSEKEIAKNLGISHRIGNATDPCSTAWCDNPREYTHDREECEVQSRNSHNENRYLVESIDIVAISREMQV